jgi:hypothetical protein
MKGLKQIEIGFENCETITISKNMIGRFSLDDIRPVIRRIACNAINKYWVAGEVQMEIFRCGNQKYKPFGQLEEQDMLERLSEYKDITSIDILYEDGTTESYLVDYDEGEYEGCLGAENINEHIYISDLGNIYVVISKDKKIEDFFGNEINDNKVVEFRKDMMDIGIEEPEEHDFANDNMPDPYRYVFLDDGKHEILAVLVDDKSNGWKIISESDDERIEPIRWKYPNEKLDRFLEEQNKGKKLDIDILKATYLK